MTGSISVNSRRPDGGRYPGQSGVLYELLSEAGYDVLVAEDGESALERTAYAQPDLILLDVMMPGIDGFETCRLLKERPDTPGDSGHLHECPERHRGQDQGLRLGAVDYVTKPFQHEEVLARVHTTLTVQRLKRELAEREARLTAIVTSAMDAILTFGADGCVTCSIRRRNRVWPCRRRDTGSAAGFPAVGAAAEGSARLSAAGRTPVVGAGGIVRAAGPAAKRFRSRRHCRGRRPPGKRCIR